jgi:hypothetical protein
MIPTAKQTLGSKVVELALTFQGACVFGGWVRDFYVRNEDFNDLDISFTTIASKTHFVDILRIMFTSVTSGEITGSRAYLNPLAHEFLTISTADSSMDSLLVDLGVQACPRQTDFTCNSVLLNKGGMLSVEGVFMQNMKHIKNKQFALAFHRDKDYDRAYYTNILQRASKLSEAGWEMLPSDKGFSLVQVVTPLTEVCSICLSGFGGIVVKTVCNHHFHMECLTKWIGHGQKRPSCPNCRFDKFLL